MLYERVARPVLFRLGHGDAETAHEWTLRKLAGLSPRTLWMLRRLFAVSAPRTVFGIDFPNAVGLAAGMDKDGRALRAWPALGFGFVEAGTVTWHPQPGNERPRMVRLRRSEAIINRMGFNNAGARALAHRLAALGPLPIPLGVSLGKSKIALLEEAVADYLASLRVVYPYADYIAVNVSSPNTPGLRSLQDRDHLDALLGALRAEASSLAEPTADPVDGRRLAGGPVKPILVKIAPDLSDQAIAEALAVCVDRGVAGVIATNTTLGRDGLAPRDVGYAGEAGGLSGRPLADRAREVVAFVHRETGGRLPIVGVGGILDPDDAVRLVDAGASLVQLYTGLVYRGARLVRDTARALGPIP